MEVINLTITRGGSARPKLSPEKCGLLWSNLDVKWSIDSLQCKVTALIIAVSYSIYMLNSSIEQLQRWSIKASLQAQNLR